MRLTVLTAAFIVSFITVNSQVHGQPAANPNVIRSCVNNGNSLYTCIDDHLIDDPSGSNGGGVLVDVPSFLTDPENPDYSLDLPFHWQIGPNW